MQAKKRLAAVYVINSHIINMMSIWKLISVMILTGVGP